jgi:hypothetical protein
LYQPIRQSPACGGAPEAALELSLFSLEFGPAGRFVVSLERYTVL